MLDNKECLEQARFLLEEFAAIAHKEGLNYDVEELMVSLKNNWTDSAFYPSTWQDIQNRRKTEINALNGAISKLGKKYGISTPHNDKMAETIRLMEDAK